tara:strand:- start:2608 stop:2814 length:207 start_codon:yes stop_codon:yes gene_type:complete
MWEVWKWNGRYIQGKLLGKYEDEKEAVQLAKSKIKFSFKKKEKKKDEIVIWLDGEEHQPVGVIVKKLK